MIYFFIGIILFLLLFIICSVKVAGEVDKYDEKH